MKDNVNISNVETISKDGLPYVKYTITIGDVSKNYERPIYNEDGQLDSIAEAVINLANKEREANVVDFADIEQETEQNKNKNFGLTYEDMQPNVYIPDDEEILEDDNEIEEEPVEVKEDHKNTKSTISNLNVYNEPKNNAKMSRNIVGYIASGLAGSIITLAILKGCSAKPAKTLSDDEKGNIVKDPVVEEDVNANNSKEDRNPEDTKIIYLTEEEYHQNVEALTNYLNEEFNFNYKPVDVNAFYYSANIDKIPNDVFKTLVEENYLPDTDIDIVRYAFNITSDLGTLFLKDKKMSNMDFSKIFADNDVVKVCDEWSKNYDAVQKNRSTVLKDNNIDTEGSTTEKIYNELIDFVIEEPTKGYNILPTGAKFIMNSIVFEPVMAVAQTNGMPANQPLDYELHDMSSFIKSLDDQFNCVTKDDEEKTKTLTK